MTGDADSAACRTPLACPTQPGPRRRTLRRILFAVGLGVGATAGALLMATAAHADDTGEPRPPGVRLTQPADRLHASTAVAPVRTSVRVVTRTAGRAPSTPQRAERQAPPPRQPDRAATRPGTTDRAAQNRATQNRATQSRATQSRPHRPSTRRATTTADGPTRHRPAHRAPATLPIVRSVTSLAGPLKPRLTPVIAPLTDSARPLTQLLPLPPARDLLRAAAGVLVDLRHTPLVPAPNGPATSPLPLGRPPAPGASQPVAPDTARPATAVRLGGTAGPAALSPTAAVGVLTPGRVSAVPGQRATALTSPADRPTGPPTAPRTPVPAGVPIAAVGPGDGGANGAEALAPAAAQAHLPVGSARAVRSVRPPRGSANAPDTRPG